MALLRAACPSLPLPEGMEELLWQHMAVEPYCIKQRVLELEGDIPRKAYYIASGMLIVEGFVDGLPYTESVYCENQMLLPNAFMRQERSLYTVTATRDSLVWSISNELMQSVYAKWPEMRLYTLMAASSFSELNRSQRSSLLALDENERVRKFYEAFPGLLPAKLSAIRDDKIASYLAILKRKLRHFRSGRSLNIL